ncbi:MAG TPA: MBL fold metallo-hydrolase [Acidimicrobiia bacterium]|nr:MBL fold metallo-hydrolase [Acidimicrobiia bacterium]
MPQPVRWLLREVRAVNSETPTPSVDLTPGVASALSPLVRRIVAPNPSLMTGPGTNTYLVGIDEVAVIDPGPDDAEHIRSIIGASMEDRIRWVLLTHTHPDHAPGAEAIRKATGAEVLAFSKKNDYVDIDGTLGDGAVVEGTEFGLEVIHTPGHADDHICFLLEEERALFSGDHIMQGTTVVVSDMAAYMASLERLKKLRRISRILPAHGEVIDDFKGTVEQYLEHRTMREKQILKALKGGPAKIEEIVQRIYAGEIPEGLMDMAARQVHAHLVKLKGEGKVSGRDARSTWKTA